MATTKKISELTATSTVSGDSLIYVVLDPSGTPTSYKASIKTVMESNVAANSAISGRSQANSFTSTYNATPANSTAVPSGFPVGTHWSDGNYLYVVTGASTLKRVAITTW